ncbi:MAG TPA: MBL fold metallo-hydrolase [Hyphomicrobiaceae bacterium]|jgi:glyoxylase-like metal-dependent hydrolase (beta-lactamase superfamily II)
MQSISRRAFVISAATAGAAFGLDGPLEFVDRAFGQQATQDVVKFKVGDIEVIQLFDGTWQKAHDPGFVRNASLDDVKGALKAGGLTDAYVPVPFTVTAVRIGGRLVLFDSGTGAQVAPTAGDIAKKNLWQAAGIDPAKVDTIIMTHLHLDHYFGLLAKDTNAPTFPNAQIHIPATEYAYWTSPTPKGAPADRIRAVFPGWKNIRQFAGDVEVVPGIRAVNSNGHTPGHTSYHVASGNQQIMVLGDVTNVRALNMTNPAWHLVFDVDPALAETNRYKLLDRVVADKVVATGYHWGAPGAGTVVKDGKGYALVPVKA